MRPNRILLAAPLLLAFAYGCRKPDNRCTEWATNTVFEPEEYLPIHPGSFWTYRKADGSLVVKAVSDEYMRHTFIMGQCTTRVAKVPVWDGRHMYGYRYPSSERVGEPSTVLVSLLKDEAAGTYWVLDHWAGTMSFRKIIARDTMIVANGTAYNHVITVAQGTGSSASPNQSALSEYRHYARGIGLVRVDRVSLTDTLPELELVDYSISQ